MYDHAWQCLECGRVYQDEPARCKCGHDDLKEVMVERDE
jgi:rRNA maturation endonuclease Nob1